MKVTGAKEVMTRFKHFYDGHTQAAVGNTVETFTRKMANESSGNAPIKDGYLKGSLASSPEKLGPTEWSFGSDLPYALRQEYEHRTHKGFVRKAVWNNREAYRKAIKSRIIEGK